MAEHESSAWFNGTSLPVLAESVRTLDPRWSMIMDRRKRALIACGAVARTKTRRPARFGPGGLHWFVLLAHPHPRASRTPRAGGAYVSAWIDFRLHEGALLLAKHYVRQRGWTVRSIVEHRWFDRLADVAPQSRPWFREARAEGACFIWHEHPRAARHRG